MPYYVCMKTRKIKGLDLGKITSFAKKPECEQLRASPQSSPKISQVSFASNESRHDSYSQFSQSLLGTPGSPTYLLCPQYKEEKWLADYDSGCSATSTNKINCLQKAIQKLILYCFFTE